MMTVRLSSMLLLMAVAVPLFAQAADPVRLTKDETQQALSGKSMTYGGKSGRQVVSLFSANGNVSQRVGNAEPSTGTWSVEDDGRFCIKIIKGKFPDACRHLLRTDAGLALSDAKGNLIPIEGME